MSLVGPLALFSAISTRLPETLAADCQEIQQSRQSKSDGAELAEIRASENHEIRRSKTSTAGLGGDEVVSLSTCVRVQNLVKSNPTDCRWRAVSESSVQIQAEKYEISPGEKSASR